MLSDAVEAPAGVAQCPLRAKMEAAAARSSSTCYKEGKEQRVKRHRKTYK